ncbi:agglutinin biogenesis protein MshP [Massilia sp. GCM10020059]|uniref:Agglutinin biogenesis protein MshP n=1 Tax=Massilia agrisoli TaxID=2892444 RepID=A0ABS8IUR5_9BURK|nr:agglutinin biogenesis protein MshP [Massilia agrisoli]MCC6072367.1 agglutinin biogenesis protein MshP [Massilia agrisoli]
MTRHQRSPLPRAARSRGVGLITAIFLLVVIAALAVAMVTVFTTQQASSALDVQGSRAYQAARAGLEWGVFKHARPDLCNSTSSFAIGAGTSLDGFTVTVTCTLMDGPDTAGGDTEALDQRKVTAVACNAPGESGACPNPTNSGDYVQRVMEATF